jgi:hypothetical protein
MRHSNDNEKGTQVNHAERSAPTSFRQTGNFARPAVARGQGGSGAPARRRRVGRAALALLLAAFGILTLAAATASAKSVYNSVGSVFGTLGGQFHIPTDVAANDTSGDFYVVDESNNRIERFGSAGNFISAWGADVDGSTVGGTDYEICTVAAECKAGAASGGNGTAAGNGTFAAPQGVAVDQDTGNVYVSDRNNRRIDEYTATGTFLRAFGYDVVASGPDQTGTGYEICDVVANPTDVCKAGVGANNSTTTSPGANPGQFGLTNNPYGYRIDVSKPDGDATTGYIYLANSGSQRIERYDLDGTSPTNFGTTANFAGGQPLHVAVGTDGVVYASNTANANEIERYDSSTSTFLTPLNATGLSGTASAATSGLEVDASSGELLVARTAAIGILEFSNPGGTPAFAGQSIANLGITPYGLGVNGANGTVFVPSYANGYRVLMLDDAGAADATGTTLPAAEVGATSAKLEGKIDDNGPLPTKWRLEISANGTDWSVVGSGETAGGATGQVVSGPAANLQPNTIYRTRLVTAKAFGGADVPAGEVSLLTDAVAPSVTGTAADSLTASSARLTAQVNPNSTQTTYHFDWGTSPEGLGNQVPIPDAQIGAGPSQVFAAQAIAGLSPGTTYYFRAVATSATQGVTKGPIESFTTPTATPVSQQRAYELVTPADKPGGQGVGKYLAADSDANAEPGIASTNGDRYLSASFAGNLTPGSFLYATDYAMSERVNDQVGWVSHSPFTHHEYSAFGGINTFLNAESASADLSVFGWGGTGAGGGALIFPQMASWPGTTAVQYVTDWQGRWEVAGPTDISIGKTTGQRFESADGSHVLLQTQTRGQLGPTDPSLDQTGGVALYDDDVSGGISNEFTPAGVRSLVGTCTGIGAGRTQIPDVDGSGKLSAQPCPPALPGRSAALISPRGASIGQDVTYTNPMSSYRAVSDDGSRIFFLSPDPSSYGTFGTPGPCVGSGATAECPPQLYVRQLDASGNPTVRWISRSAVPGQAASLTATSIYEGASVTGSKVFFRTKSPLTSDDPNNTGSAPVTSGTPSAESWDLYQYSVPSNSEGRPDGTDPGDGTLTRISAGPTGAGDCNVVTGSGANQSLRFASDDGNRLYFVCAAPLAGVATNGVPSDGTITTASGSPTNNTTRNLYYYDATKPFPDRWEFVAQLPTNATAFDKCATTEPNPGQPVGFGGAGTQFTIGRVNCFKGTADGKFVTFDTSGRLVAGDPDPSSIDVYAFDAEADRLIRIDAPQGGAGGTYPCTGNQISKPDGFCYGDSGLSSLLLPMLGVVTKPAAPGEHIAFFQSKSPLVPADTNDQYDVYEWHNGKLSLISVGTGAKGSYYAGNSADGRDVFIETSDRLTWQDSDGVMDVYDARRGGGIPEPPPPPACAVLVGACQAPAPATPASTPPASASFSGPGNPPTAQPKKPKKKHKKHKKRHAKHQAKKHKQGKKNRKGGQPKHGQNRTNLAEQRHGGKRGDK